MLYEIINIIDLLTPFTLVYIYPLLCLSFIIIVFHLIWDIVGGFINRHV